MPDEQQQISTEDVRAGTTPHIVRYVLGISMALVIIGLAFVVLV